MSPKYAGTHQTKAQHHSPEDHNMNKRHCLLQSYFVTVLPMWYMILLSSKTILKDTEQSLSLNRKCPKIKPVRSYITSPQDRLKVSTIEENTCT